MDDCVFCKIIAGQIPGEFVHRDDTVVVFKDINPVTKIHLLIVPREHIVYLTDITEKNSDLIVHMVMVANKIAKQLGVAKTGFRLVINCGEEGGQLIKHLHMHLLAGGRLSDKMG